MKSSFLKIAIMHKMSYAGVVFLADAIEHEGKIVFPEISELSGQMMCLIEEVHAAVMVDQVRRGIIRDGESSKVIPRRFRLNG